MGMNNPQEECPDTSKCTHCKQPIRDIEEDWMMPYEKLGFCTVVCEALWLRREMIRRGTYTLDGGIV